MRSILPACVILISAAFTLADGPADNNLETVRRVPRLGVEVPAEKREQLQLQLAALEQRINNLKLRSDTLTHELLPDVLIYHKAADWALRYQEFFDVKEIDVAIALIKEGMERADQLDQKKPLWPEQTGLVVRGYISKIDGSVQPYGLVIPKSYSEKSPRVRCDLWFHGRGETLSELNFIQQRRTQVGEIAPADTIVLHPYGRYCNAAKFAGEVDALEALDAVKKHYRIDDDRVSVRGFSMGGASAWQFAVHYPDRWFAANPGAGFSETPEFLKVFQKEELKPQWWEVKLWQLYDCPGYAANLRSLPLIAYSGELDSQKQAADRMEAALAREGMTLAHIIGPQTKHAIHKDSKAEIEKRLASIDKYMARGRVPTQVEFTTFTLRYSKMHWVRITGMEEHWKKASIRATVSAGGIISVKTENVTDFTLDFEAGQCPFDVLTEPEIYLGDNRTPLRGPAPQTDRSWRMHFQLNAGTRKWSEGSQRVEDAFITSFKRPGLQGPIDDAFMDSFIFVRPTGKARSEALEKWSRAELERAIEHWRRHFRGDARVRDDKDITEADIASSNLILWGDPQSNAIMAKIEEKMPIEWSKDGIVVWKKGEYEPRGKYDNENHALILINPNPLNPKRYVVFNSGFTFREYAYLNNARQVPMLPDWAVVDLRTPPDTVWPGKIADAGFFNEEWRLKARETKE